MFICRADGAATKKVLLHKMHIKRAWHLLVFIGIFEVLDYLLSPITTFKSTPMAGTPSLGLGINLKVSKFQRFQSSVNFAIFYSVMCISVLCFLHHRHSIWFYYPFCILLLLTPYCGYYCPRGGENLRYRFNLEVQHRCAKIVRIFVSGKKSPNIFWVEG